MNPRNVDRGAFQDHERVVLLEQDNDRYDMRMQAIASTLRWILTTLVVGLVSTISGLVLLYIQRR